MQMRFPKLINKMTSTDTTSKNDKKSDSQADQVDEEEDVDDRTEDEDEDFSEELETSDNLQEKKKRENNQNFNTNVNGGCCKKVDENNTDGEEINDEDDEENKYEDLSDDEDSLKCADCQDENTLHLCYKIFGITKRSIKERIRKKYNHFQNEMKSKQKKMLDESNSKLGVAPICLIPFESFAPLTLIERFNLFVKAYSSVIGKFFFFFKLNFN